MKRLSYFLLLFILSVFSFFSCSEDNNVTPATTGIISGVITDSQTGADISGATVTSDGGEFAATNVQGEYTLTVPAGARTLTITKNNFITATENVQVTAGGTFTKDAALTPSPVQIPGMIFVRGGTYQMGKLNGTGSQTPVHEVTVSSFYISRYEVKQSEYLAVMGINHSFFPGASMPAEQVTWYEAVAYCNAKSTAEGLTPVYNINGSTVSADWTANGYRLPSEAEWEFAARGGIGSVGTPYSGALDLGIVGWYEVNSDNSTHMPGMKPPNELGLYDMSGNVSEWCWDFYSDSYYSISPTVNPKGPDTGDVRVRRGGSWHDAATFCEVWSRRNFNPESSQNYLGFRLVRTN